MPEVPASDGESTTETIEGGYFEEEYHISASETAAFLHSLAEQIEAGDAVTISGDEWELPFAFEEPIELEVEYEGDDEPELEIEIELDGRVADEAPEIADAEST